MDIQFPIYPIRQHFKIWEDSGITYINTFKNEYIIDNKNLSGNFVQRRRGIKQKPLYPLYNPLLTHRDLILDRHHKTKMYVDSSGKVFKYTREKFYPIKYHWIQDRAFVDNWMFLQLQTITPIIQVPLTSENVDHDYIGLIELDHGYIYYETSKFRKKNSRIKI